MTLRLTPQTLEAAYEFLRTTPPFRRWKLPEGGDVEFFVGRHQIDSAGYARGKTARHRIIIHETGTGHTWSLIEHMAHEMVHLSLDGTPHAKVDHGAEFKRRAARVCKHHGFDPKRF